MIVIIIDISFVIHLYYNPDIIITLMKISIKLFIKMTSSFFLPSLF